MASVRPHRRECDSTSVSPDLHFFVVLQNAIIFLTSALVSYASTVSLLGQPPIPLSSTPKPRQPPHSP
ncbi:hypothetical protein BU24DRAFT_43029 [Aaosphaeria arxii CBS 175.79]|uniref:Uncharacterized protein n=1 Tax=Aaosphaeria arxii CBS 175.79 TaxID=1450172 RepID=A0A6A5Y9R4_9PLEO|nr:uncharacterized protein BU24DRAFT_43029 [Aaosphaeria arxii CBS 175.79]KAF2022322.1 hypothetical protein BU24DRAFT_43029 [Aaosphaeria arxii CBS 175.79]